MLHPAPELGPPTHPALLKRERERAEARQNRIADKITGVLRVDDVRLRPHHWFACWIGFGVENYPYGLLAMIVSLEAIFLSMFVLISQNRADARRQVIADQQWQTVQEEDKQKVELLDLSRQILSLTTVSRARSRILGGLGAQHREAARAASRSALRDVGIATSSGCA